MTEYRLHVRLVCVERSEARNALDDRIAGVGGIAPYIGRGYVTLIQPDALGQQPREVLVAGTGSIICKP